MPSLLEYQPWAINSDAGGTGAGGTNHVPVSNATPTSNGSIILGLNGIPLQDEQQKQQHQQTDKQATQEASTSPNCSSGKHAQLPLATAAASSSDYYQMPSILQPQGGGMAPDDADTTGSDGEMDSPLPPLDTLAISEPVPNHFGSGGGYGGTSGADSGYFRMPGGFEPMSSADTSTSKASTPAFGENRNSTDASSAYVSSVGASPSSSITGLFGSQLSTANRWPCHAVQMAALGVITALTAMLKAMLQEKN